MRVSRESKQNASVLTPGGSDLLRHLRLTALEKEEDKRDSYEHQNDGARGRDNKLLHLPPVAQRPDVGNDRKIRRADLGISGRSHGQPLSNRDPVGVCEVRRLGIWRH